MAVSFQKSIAASHTAPFEIRIGAGDEENVGWDSAPRSRTGGLIMKLQTIETIEEFVAQHDQWNALLESSTSNCVFLTHEWLSTWWKHLAHGRLRIVTARDRGN